MLHMKSCRFPLRLWGLLVGPLFLGGSALSTAAEETKPNLSLVPGVVIDYSPASSKRYIGSPSLVVLPNGDYIASHDFFGPGTKYNRTRIHRSRDKGASWETLTDIRGAFWNMLFVRRGDLYLFGPDEQYGNAVIRRSKDGGATWTSPDEASTGLLCDKGQYHCAPMPVIEHNDRLWRAMEHRDPPKQWGVNFRALVMSAPVDADLLKADSWTFSNRLRYDPDWPGSAWLEGNIVVLPDGRMVNILRNHSEEGGRAAVVEVESKDKVSFDPATGFIDMPGGSKKFAIRRDGDTGLYWTLTNWIHPADANQKAERTRNTLALASSPDAINWTVRDIILRHPDPKKTGFQYVDWLFEGDDLIVACRAAFDDGLGGAHNCHDANFLTFHRVTDFRSKATATVGE